MKTALCGMCTLGVISNAPADVIYWGTQGFLRHSDSRGGDWNSDFEVRLGVFRAGFLPTPENLGQWDSHWMTLGTAAFDPQESRYAGMSDDSAPLPAGYAPQVYLRAENGTRLADGPEWLLLTHPDWIWTGRTSASAAPARTWIADEASLAILGSVANRDVHLASVAVRPAPVTFEHWIANHAVPTERQSPGQDPDGDGISNHLEYLLGTDPNVPSAITSPQMQVEATGVRLMLPRNPEAVSTFVLEQSSDLKTWRKAASTTIADQPNRIEVLASKDGSESSVFYRFQLQTPPKE